MNARDGGYCESTKTQTFLSQKPELRGALRADSFFKGMARTSMPTREVAEIKKGKFVEVQEFSFAMGLVPARHLAGPEAGARFERAD
ncbi:MAG: hypothetical protein JO015_09430 [Verrucomicrobia bacterium]|nr:hypothetical protein [Verrucomicrobiota bacterium]